MAGLMMKSEIFSFVFFTLFCWNWWCIRFHNADEKWWRTYLFPLIMLVWVNSHGAFVFGAVFLLVIAFGELLNLFFRKNTLTPKTQKHFLVACILSAVAVLITPYGYQYPLQIIMLHLPTSENVQYMNVIGAYTQPFANIKNTLPLTFADLANLSLALLVLLMIGAGFKNIEWSMLITNITFVVIYTKLLRTTYFWPPVFAFSSIFLMQFHSKILYPQRKVLKKIFLFSVLAAVITFSSFVVRDAVFFPPPLSWLGVGLSNFHPEDEADFIQRYLPDKVVGNTYNEGSYLLWKRYPENKVFIDSRHFPYVEWSQEFYKVSAIGGEVEHFLEKFQAEVWVISLADGKLNRWFFTSSDWNLVYYGQNSAVYLRSDLPVPPREKRVSESVEEVKNNLTSLNLLKFSVDIRDWKTAVQVVERIKTYFRHPGYTSLREFAPLYLEGMRAYVEGEYKMAAEKLFEAGRYTPFSINHEIAYSHLFWASIKMNNKQTLEAYALAERAYLFIPRDIYTVYNFAVIDWYVDKMQLKSEGTKKEIKEEVWRKLFATFVEGAPPTSKALQECHKFATAVLSGKKPAKLPQLLPERPQNKPYYYPLD